MSKIKSKFCKGNFVEVIDWVKHYSTYSSMARELKLKNWTPAGGWFKDAIFEHGGKFGKVVAEKDGYVGIYIDGRDYIIGEEGLCKVKRFKKCGIDDFEEINYRHEDQDTVLPSITRKDMPLFSGVLRYFPDTLLEVSKVSKIGNDQHNPGEPIHWDRSKSTDELDALARHLIDAGKLDTDGQRHSAKIAWRALANLQKEIENDRKEI